MQAPVKVTPQRFNELVEEFLRNACHYTGSEQLHRLSCEANNVLQGCDCPVERSYACKRCGANIQWHRAFMSIHDASWGGCAGYGEVIHPTFPYCSVCEPKPSPFGCVHVGEVAGELSPDRGKLHFVPDPPPPPVLKRYWRKIASRFMSHV